jgi:hypothetical protein
MQLRAKLHPALERMRSIICIVCMHVPVVCVICEYNCVFSVAYPNSVLPDPDQNLMLINPDPDPNSSKI